MTVLAASRWTTNADMILDVHRLGYLRDEDTVLDPTYGRGMWWKKWRPTFLYAYDRKLQPWWDFTAMEFRDMVADEILEPHATPVFDVVAFDPPYVSVGGRATSGMPEFHENYGLDSAPKTPAGVQEIINLGLAECFRVVKKRGLVLVKCQDYISSGKLWAGTHYTLTHALQLGFEYVDRLERVQPNPRPQPSSNRRQVHARRNLSTLLVLRRPR